MRLRWHDIVFATLLGIWLGSTVFWIVEVLRAPLMDESPESEGADPHGQIIAEFNAEVSRYEHG